VKERERERERESERERGMRVVNFFAMRSMHFALFYNSCCPHDHAVAVRGALGYGSASAQIGEDGGYGNESISVNDIPMLPGNKTGFNNPIHRTTKLRNGEWTTVNPQVCFVYFMLYLKKCGGEIQILVLVLLTLTIEDNVNE
jgi:hypothetical protein